MIKNRKAEGVVRAIVNLCRSVHALSLAEGIENERILDKLRELGCDEGQGYYFSPPMSFEELRGFLNRNG